MRNATFAALFTGLVIAPTVGYGDPIDVILVQYTPNAATEIDTQLLQKALGEALERSLALQGMHLVDLRDLALADALPSSSDTLAFRDFAVQRLKGKDYAISLSLTAIVTRNSVSRVAKLSADGAVVDIATGEVLTTYSVNAPESIILPVSEAECNSACAELKLADAKSGLGRELSFVLTQKMHFLQEDGLISSLSDPVAISERLKPKGERPAIPEVVIGSGSEYTVDAARALNVEVFFEPNSDKLTDLARTQLAALGQALQDPSLFQSRYLIIGHTDATGTAEFNLALSEHRAARVRDYLIDNYSVAEGRIASIGLGESKLKEVTNPNWGINRRVEVALLLQGPTRATDSVTLKDYSITLNLFDRDEAIQIVRALQHELKKSVELERSSTTQRVYVLRSDKQTEDIEQALLRVLKKSGFLLGELRITIVGEEITLDKL